MRKRSFSHERWAHFRFSVIGSLLAAPPPKGKLGITLWELAQRQWQHPITGEELRLSRSTLERWYRAASSSPDPVAILRRRRREDEGKSRVVSLRLRQVLANQRRDHPTWSYQLHLDNLRVLVQAQPELGPLPSYSTLRRTMIAAGWVKLPRKKSPKAPGRQREVREVRSYEAEYVGGLWHLDFHHGSHKVLTHAGTWKRPILLAILDDHSRLVCHLQWYLSETAECLVHGLIQAFIKRGLCRALLSDNGSAMLAGETREGLERLSVIQRTTLVNSPHQNGKQESFFFRIEARLLAMLEGHPDLDLAMLNRATLAWVEQEYHRTVHSETKQTPLDRFLNAPSVLRRCPAPEELEIAFTATSTRALRRSDLTVSFKGIRFEVPVRFRHLERVTLRFRSWDQSSLLIVDQKTGVLLDRLFPIDKARNANAKRRVIQPAKETEPTPQNGIAPLLEKLIKDTTETGLPPAYLTKDEDQ